MAAKDLKKVGQGLEKLEKLVKLKRNSRRSMLELIRLISQLHEKSTLERQSLSGGEMGTGSQLCLQNS